MKKLIYFVLILLFSIALFSCSDKSSSPHNECIDNDGDLRCDVCDKDMSKAPEHTECVDTDADGKCDECGKDVAPIEPPHTECVDTDADGKCDECGKDVALIEPPHTECVDTDTDGKCDGCGKEVITYDITSIMIGGRDIRDYVICVNESDTESYRLAKYLNEILLENAGFELSIAEYGSVTDKYISIITAERSGGEGFYVKVNSRNLEIVSEFSNKTLDMGILYFTEKIALGEGEITLSDAKANVRDISYEEFGAVGDGKTDDSEAIRATHIYANEYGHTVVADSRNTYYIGPMEEAIPIKTDVYWGSANFIIDDSKIKSGNEARKVSVFTVISDSERVVLKPESCEAIAKINAQGGIDAESCKKLDLGLGYPALLVVYNNSLRQYTHIGVSASGYIQQETVVIDKDGNIDEKTRFCFDFETVTYIHVYRNDDTPIVIDGGIFTQIVYSPKKSEYLSYSRNISVNRSNTTIKNISYQIRGEAENGFPYVPFLYAQTANNVLFENCRIQAHKAFYVKGSAPNNQVAMASYAMGANGCANVTFKKCIQTNFFDETGEARAETTYFVSISNSKNLTVEESVFSNVLAARNNSNISITDSAVGFISAVGSGSLNIVDSHMYSDVLITLRAYDGAYWNGDIVIKDVTVHNVSDVSLISASWYNYNFGINASLPESITIDNLLLVNDAKINVFSPNFVETSNKNPSREEVEDYDGTPIKNRNPLKPTEKIEISSNSENYTFIIPENEFFKDLSVVFK